MITPFTLGTVSFPGDSSGIECPLNDNKEKYRHLERSREIPLLVVRIAVSFPGDSSGIECPLNDNKKKYRHLERSREIP